MKQSPRKTTAAVPASVRDAVANEQLPALVLDLDSIDENIADLHRRAAAAGGPNMPIRVASKSLRIPELIRYVLGKPGFRGVLAFSLAEALELYDAGISDDILVAYPTTDESSLHRLAEDYAARRAITLMVDSTEHADLIVRGINSAREDSNYPDEPVRVCIDVDASLRFGTATTALVHIGTLRSPVHSARQAAKLARKLDQYSQLKVCGIMMYEGHIAGVGDQGHSIRARTIQIMQALARRELARRRAKVVRAVEREIGALELVNGGGTGSLESTCAETVITEAAAGSGVLAPTLFDAYRAFSVTPASWFVLPVVRRPRGGRRNAVATVAGGGRIASGPADQTRLPTPVFPPALRYAPEEGPGEVQTPLVGATAADLKVGDQVWFRHAKAGETAEHANEAIVVRGGVIIDRWATYRGKGYLFT